MRLKATQDYNRILGVPLNRGKHSQITVQLLKSKTSKHMRKVRVSGTVNGVAIRAESLPFFVGIDIINDKLVSSILPSVFRVKGGKASYSARIQVEHAVLRELQGVS